MPSPWAEKKPRYFAPLGASLSYTFKALVEVGLLAMPRQYSGLSGGRKVADPEAFCEFHGYHDHTTERCKALKHQIQSLKDDEKLLPELEVAGGASIVKEMPTQAVANVEMSGPRLKGRV